MRPSDRVLPACGICRKLGRTCSYPLTAEKPGPKPGDFHSREDILFLCLSSSGVPQRRKNGRFLHVNPSVAVSNERCDADQRQERSNQISTASPSHRQSPLPLNTHGQYTFGLTEVIPRHLGPAYRAEEPNSYDGSNTAHPEASEVPSLVPDNSESGGETLASLLHPSHDPLYQLSAAADEVANRDARSEGLLVSIICKDFNISNESYRQL